MLTMMTALRSARILTFRRVVCIDLPFTVPRRRPEAGQRSVTWSSGWCDGGAFWSCTFFPVWRALHLPGRKTFRYPQFSWPHGPDGGRVEGAVGPGIQG